jgi:hypothetical protein
MPTLFITDTSHYTTVLNLAAQAKISLWIGTADIKDLYVHFTRCFYGEF